MKTTETTTEEAKKAEKQAKFDRAVCKVIQAAFELVVLYRVGSWLGLF